jgi:hypothetical protein
VSAASVDIDACLTEPIDRFVKRVCQRGNAVLGCAAYFGRDASRRGGSLLEPVEPLLDRLELGQDHDVRLLRVDADRARVRRDLRFDPLVVLVLSA